MRNWRIRSIGARWQYEFFYVVIRRFGRRSAYLMADLVTFYYVLARPSVRQRCRPYLSRRFPHRSPVGRILDAFRLCREFARILVDRASMGIRGPGELETQFAGCETLKALLSEGHGLILLTAHAGAWQLGMANLPALGCPVALLNHREDSEADRHFYEHQPNQVAFTLIDPLGYLGGVPDMVQVLQRGEILCIMGDRTTGSQAATVSVDFLGGAVRFPYSPYKLASATGAPIAVILPFKPHLNQHDMRLAGVIRVPPNLGRNPRAYQPYAAAFVSALSDFVGDFPYHFFNFFDLWEGRATLGTPSPDPPTKEPKHGH